jgi:hypothetical protein
MSKNYQDNMNNFVKAFSLFFSGEILILFIFVLIQNIDATINPISGGHSFEHGGLEGFIFSATIYLVVAVVHTLIFMVPLLFSIRYGLGVLNIKPLLAAVLGAISGVALIVAPTGGIPTVIFAPTITFCALIIAIELYAKNNNKSCN